MTEKEIHNRIQLEWTAEPNRATAAHDGVQYAVSVDLVGSSGQNDWEWIVWVNDHAHFAPRLAERLTSSRESGLENGKTYAEGLAFNAQEMKERRAAARLGNIPSP